MAVIPESNQQADIPQRRFQPLSAGAPETLNLDGLEQSLQQRAAQQRPADLEKQAGIGAANQLALDASKFAAPDPSLDPAYAKAQRDAASHVQLLQAQGDAQVKYQQLESQHYLDPNGFATAWDAYTKGAVAPLQDAAPDQAAKVGETLLQIGQRGRALAVERQGAFQREDQKAEFSGGLQDIADTSVQALEAGGPHAYDTFLQSVQDYQKYAQGGVTNPDGTPSILMSPQAAQAQTRRAHDVLANAYVTGQTRDAIESGNYGKLKFVQQQIEGGALFLDPKREQAALGAMSAQVKSAQAQARQQGQLIALDAKNQIDGISAGAAQNLPVDMEELKRLAATVNQYASTPQERMHTLEKVAAVQTVAQIQPQIQSAGPQDLAAMKTYLGANAANLGPEAVKTLGELLSSRQRALDSAVQRGDYAAIGPKLDILTATAQQLATRQRTVAGQLGVSPTAVNLVDNDQLKQVESQFKVAESKNDTQSQMSLAQNLVSKLGYGAQAAFKGAKTASPALSFAGALITAGDTATAQSLLAMGNTGKGSAGAAGSFKFDSTTYKALDAVSNGDPATNADLADYLKQAYAGAMLQARAKDPSLSDSDAKSAASAAIAGVVKSIQASASTLANGRQILAPKTDVQGLNAFMAAPGSFQGHADALSSIQPVPVNGGYAFKGSDGAVLADAKGQPILYNAQPHPAALAPNAAPIQGAAASVGKNLAAMPEASASMSAATAERVNFLPHGILDSIYRATQGTSPAERVGVGDFSVPAKAGANGAQAPNAASVLSKYLIQTRDLPTALASYATTPELVKSLQSNYGAQWQAHLPPNAGTFVQKVLDAHGRQ